MKLKSLMALVAVLSMGVTTATADSKPYWQDLNVTSVNTEPVRSSFMTYGSRENALTGDYNRSEYYQLLNGTWKFYYAKRAAEVPAGLTDENVDTRSWNDIKVPGNWELQGFGDAIYTNHAYDFWPKNPRPPMLPDENPVGVYRRTFTVPAEWNGRDIYLNLAGAKSGVYVYINGIMCGVTVYPEGDNFNQVNPVGLTIGADSCGLDLYVLRIYNKGLNEAEQLNNFICDRSTLADRIAADERNDILSKQNGEVTIQDLPMTIPYIILECEELPQYKGDKKKNKSVTFVDQMHPERSFTATGV